ncbi:MAG TPA: AAA family ATPase [Chthoniobacterales bacterium]
MSDGEPFDDVFHEGSAGLSPVEQADRLISILQPDNPLRIQLIALRASVSEQEEMILEARRAIEQLEEVVKKVTSPANRIGTFIAPRGKETAQIVVAGSDYFCNVDPRVPLVRLKTGTRVLVNEAYVIVGDLGYDTLGPVAKVVEVLGEDRLRVGSEQGLQSSILLRSASMVGKKVKTGDEVRVDGNMRVAVELLSKPSSQDYYLESVPELPWDHVGGQREALSAIRDAIELPLVHSDLFARYKHSTPKGFLLHGPPGCGKTLIGKATAYNLTRHLAEKTGERVEQYFMHIKGPEILNMWLGESERMVREIFATAREKRREGFLPFLFIDEAESILGTRRATRNSSILSTLVPMFCTEMDGIESLSQVVIILASNRADLIDPAILRPGRIDRKIKVSRPDRPGSLDIYRIYLTPDLPYDPKLLSEHGSVEKVIDYLANRIVDRQFAKTEENRFLEITLRSARKETLYRGDLTSGALIASIVARAKEFAIKRAIESKVDEGICEEDLITALTAEYEENDLFPPGEITEDWLKLIDYDPDNVVRIRPVRPVPPEAIQHSKVV